jgi:membrane associated rhomboid family serine protease
MPRYRQVSYSFGPPLTPVVKRLIIVMAAVFAVTNILGALPSDTIQLYLQVYPRAYLGLIPWLVIHRLLVWQMVTYLFLHGGWLHIIFNLFALWMFGSDLESLWGDKKFLFYFFLTGIGAGLFCVLLQPSSQIPTLGCSGAIFGLLLAYGMIFPDRPIYLYMIVPIKAKWFAVIMGVMEFVASYSDAGSGISHVAHLGGMLFGFFYLRGWNLPYTLQRRYHDWRRARLRSRFEVYMRKQEKKDDASRWIN